MTVFCKNKKSINSINIISMYFILFYFSPYIKIQCLCNKILLISESEITLTIRGTGKQKILNKESVKLFDNLKFKTVTYNFNTNPSEILINGNNQETIDFYAYNLNSEENNITIRFTEDIIYCDVMFNGLSNIISIKMNNFDFSKVKSMKAMFKDCTNLVSIDLSNFDATCTTDIGYLFFNCTNLISVNLNNFTASSAQSMDYMFYNCQNLVSLDLKDFDTTSVIQLSNMFQFCSSLTILDLSSFYIPLTTNMGHMFSNCSSLISLDLSSFGISSIKYMDYIFSGCINLVSLNLGNINTNKSILIDNMFEDCKKLISLDLSNFDTSSLTKITNMFKGCDSSLIYCINNDNKNNELLKNELKNYNFLHNCSHICFEESKKIILNDRTCKFNCTSTDKFNYKDICFSLSCPLGTYNLSNNTCIKYNYIDKDYDYIIYSSIVIDNITNIISPDNSYSFSSVISMPSLDINIESYIIDTIYSFSSVNSKPSSDINIVSDIINTKYSSYSTELLFDDKTDINNDISLINEYNYYFHSLVYSKNKSNDKDYIISKIRYDLIKGNLDKFISNIIENENKDIIINDKDNKIIYQLTTSYNQQNNKYINISNINLGKCEIKLKLHYNITDNSTLLIIKMDIYKEELLIPIVEYEVYNIKTKEKLDLNLCSYMKIYKYIPVSINENNLFMYNSSNEYYNDFCYPYSTEKNTDIILKDRRNEYINNNMSLCEKNCKYCEYNKDTKKALCECFIKINFPLISEIEINKDLLLRNFEDIKNIINIYIIKCYYKLFKKEGIIKNMGFYIMSVMIIFSIILSLLFRIKGYNNLKKQIDDIIKSQTKNNYIENKITNNNPPKNKYKKNIIIKKNNSTIKKINTKLEKSNNSSESKIYITSKSIKYIKKEPVNSINNNILNIIKTDIDISLNYNDYEMNNLTYIDALKLDKRTYRQYYFSLLKTKHLAIFTFYTKTDYNSRLIKIILFLFCFSLYFTVNALFFNDGTIHTIYIDEGSFNFIYQIPQILYSTLITSLISIIIKNLSLSEKNILEIKREKSNSKEKSIKIIKCLNIKFILFFILLFLFLFLFWYYLSCFCAVYVNTQIHLIKDTLISFSLSLIYPFILNLFPGLFRMPSLKNSNRELIYKISNIIQLI